MVPRSYFSSKRYLARAEWAQTWQNALKCDYQPVVEVSAIPASESPTVLVPEILKYQTKPSDLVSSRDWLIGLTEQLHGTRAISIGGRLQKPLAEVGREPQALTDSQEEECFGQDVRFIWNPNRLHYYLNN
jgi:hypothetical protein